MRRSGHLNFLLLGLSLLDSGCATNRLSEPAPPLLWRHCWKITVRKFSVCSFVATTDRQPSPADWRLGHSCQWRRCCRRCFSSGRQPRRPGQPSRHGGTELVLRLSCRTRPQAKYATAPATAMTNPDTRTPMAASSLSHSSPRLAHHWRERAGSTRSIQCMCLPLLSRLAWC